MIPILGPIKAAAIIPISELPLQWKAAARSKEMITAGRVVLLSMGSSKLKKRAGSANERAGLKKEK